MARILLLSAFCAAILANCAAPQQIPSLAPRAAELIDPRLPVSPSLRMGPVSAPLAAQLGSLIAQAKSGDVAFGAAAVRAERLAAGAGAPPSESWIAAQQALSALVAEREPTVRALADIDAIVASAIAAGGGMPASDLAAAKAAAEEVAAIDRAHERRIDYLQQRLSG